MRRPHPPSAARRSALDVAAPRPASSCATWVKTYPGAPTPAVDHLTLEVPAGEICVFVGPSGCGQDHRDASDQRMIARDSGEILLDGTDVNAADPAQLRREIGYVIQQVGCSRTAAWPRTSARCRTARVEQARRSPIARASCWSSSGSATAAGRRYRTSSPAVNASASGWPGRSPPIRRCSSWTSVRRDRPDHPRPPAERVPPAPAEAAPHDRVRHARHRRGAIKMGDRIRRPAHRWSPRAVRHAAECCSTRSTCSSSGSSAPTAPSSASRSAAPPTSTCCPSCRSTTTILRLGAAAARRCAVPTRSSSSTRRPPGGLARRGRSAPRRVRAAERLGGRGDRRRRRAARRVLGAILQHRVRYAVVVVDRGRATGVLSADRIADELLPPARCGVAPAPGDAEPPRSISPPPRRRSRARERSWRAPSSRAGRLLRRPHDRPGLVRRARWPLPGMDGRHSATTCSRSRSMRCSR